MKKLLLILILGIWHFNTRGQITIMDTDMPVHNDTLRFSSANAAAANINLGLTGANMQWDFSGLVATAQGVDTFYNAIDLGFSGSGVGYKVADTLDFGASGIRLNNVYQFFERLSGPGQYALLSMGGYLNGTAHQIQYSDPDEIYFFPLDYTDHDSSTFRAEYSIPLIASLMIKGTRVTDVDGYGTITTPHFTTPVDVIRVRSEVYQTDSVILSNQSITTNQRHYVEYKWLAKDEHYPVLWVVADIGPGDTETPSQVRYRDHARSISGVPVAGITDGLKVYPNPVADNRLHLQLPASWRAYRAEVFDMRGAVLMTAVNTQDLDIAKLSPGNYLVRVSSGNESGWIQITK